MLDDLRRDHKIQGGEFKGSRLLEKAKGWRLLEDLLRAIGSKGGLVIYNVVEKRYAIAAKVIETFLDPAYNRRVPNEFTYQAETKQDLADLVSQLPDGVLHDFARVYRAPDGPALKRSLDAICSALRERNQGKLSVLLAGARRVTDEIAELEAMDDGEIPGAGMPTLNLPVFAALLYKLEEIGRLSGSRAIGVVHDETKEFFPTFQWWFDKMRQAEEGVVHLQGGAKMMLPLRTLLSFESVVSDISPGVQAADLFARAVCLPATRAVLNGPPLPPEAATVMEVLVAGALVEVQLGTPMMSASVMRRFMGPYLTSMREALS